MIFGAWSHRPFFYATIAAVQQMLRILHNLGDVMFDFDKQIKEVTAQVKKYNEMWINWTIAALEQIKK